MTDTYGSSTKAAGASASAPKAKSGPNYKRVTNTSKDEVTLPNTNNVLKGGSSVIMHISEIASEQPWIGSTETISIEDT